MGDVAFAAGFASIRTFNDTVREVFALSPSELRARAGAGRPGQRPAPPAPGALSLRLPFRAPLFPDNLFGHLAATAVPGVEEWRDGAYRRTLRLPHGPGVVALRPQPDHIGCQLSLTDLRDLATAISRCRRLLDLDADPVAVDDLLRRRPGAGPAGRQGARPPGARAPPTRPSSRSGRCSASRSPPPRPAPTPAGWPPRYGEPVDGPGGRPDPAVPRRRGAGRAGPGRAGAAPVPARDLRRADRRAGRPGELDLSAGGDWAEARLRLAALPGIGPWTVETIAMRALGDPDAFPATDLGVRAAARELGLPGHPGRADQPRRPPGGPGGPTRCSTCGPPATTPSTTCPPPPERISPMTATAVPEPGTAIAGVPALTHVTIGSPIGAAHPGRRRRRGWPGCTWTRSGTGPARPAFGTPAIRPASRSLPPPRQLEAYFAGGLTGSTCR